MYVYKNSSQDKKYKKTFANASRLVKFANFFFHKQFPIYGKFINTFPTSLLTPFVIFSPFYERFEGERRIKESTMVQWINVF